jgi:1,2-phenylacetyl-CoA epoxidase PaaB subunit
MPQTRIEMQEIYHRQPDGSSIMQVVEVEITEQTPEELLAEKEAELLKVYQEIQAIHSKLNQ